MRITQLAYEEDYIITYTNRSMTEKDHECQTGAGWVVYWKGLERRNGREGMGELAEVYNAEMLALLRGLETVIKFQQETPNTNRRHMRIILFADNTASVTAIMKEDPRSSQQILQTFVETTIVFLNVNRRVTIEISWVPGHMGIEGNNRADALVKEATGLKLARETTTLAKIH